MNSTEINYNNITSIDKSLFNIIRNSYQYDLVIFVAKGGYLIGKDLANFKNVPLLEIESSRSGNGLKKIIKPFIKIIPNIFLLWLRKKEVNSNVHAKKQERIINFDNNIWSKYKDKERILLVDDSVDTGYSIKSVYEVVSKFFLNAEVKIASLNLFDESKKIVNVDYSLFHNYIIKGPWSTDSIEHKRFIDEYTKWHKNQGD